MIARGAENVPIAIGGVILPTTARMNLQITSGVFQPLAYIPLASVASGSGLFFMNTLSFAANGVGGSAANTLEGCVRFISPASAQYPGFLLSSGTEDYYDSGA
jgi:hypothetical protein